MRTLELDNVFVINGRLAIKLSTFAKMLNYSDTYLLKLIKKLLKLGIKIAFKWRKNWYIFLPKNKQINSINQIKNFNNNNSVSSGDIATNPSGSEINTDWNMAVNELPPDLSSNLERTIFTITSVNGRLVIPTRSVSIQRYSFQGASSGVYSSALIPKNPISFVPSNLGQFRAMTDYKYGYYIIYDEAKMSTFNPGTSGTLNSTQIPQAFFEICRALDAAEKARNAANPGLPPRQNLSTTVSFDTGLIAVASTLPITTSIQTDGGVKVVVADYLGAAYSTFANGGGDLKSDTLPEALLEIASFLAAAEKAVTPAENQPNNVQISFDLEAGNATISANLPFNTSPANNGDVTIHAIDYL